MTPQIKIGRHDTVVFDIDDTTGFFTNSFDAWLATRFKTSMPDRNVHRDYNLLSPWLDHFKKGITANEVLKEFEATGAIEDPTRFHPTSVVNLVKALQDQGTMCIALTARGWMIDGEEATREWLKKLGILMPTYVLGLKDSKAEWLRKNIRDNRSEYSAHNWVERPKTFVVEDNPHHLKDIAWTCLHIETPIVVDHPHNRSLSSTLFKRVDPYHNEWMETWPNCATLL